jgi:hypothetical protein
VPVDGMIPVGFDGSTFGWVEPAVTGGRDEGGRCCVPGAPPLVGGGWTVVGVDAPPDGGIGGF